MYKVMNKARKKKAVLKKTWLKTAAIEIQFNWIFVLIAGGILLIFIISLITAITRSGNQTIDSDALQNINLILKTAQQASINSDESFRTIYTQGSQIKFSCDQDGISEIKIGSLAKNTENLAVFSRNDIKGKELSAWTINWQSPFLVTSFLTISDERTQYVFINSPSNYYISDIYNSFPLNDTLRHKILLNDITALNDTGFDNYRIVYYGMPTRQLNSGLSGKASWLLINETNGGVDNYGIIRFCKGNSFTNCPTSYFIKKESLYGAIFSEDKEYYECTMKKAFRRMKYSTSLLLDRTLALERYYSANYGSCGRIYDASPIYLRGLLDNSTYLTTQRTLDYQSVAQIYSLEQGLERENLDASLGSCPTIY